MRSATAQARFEALKPLVPDPCTAHMVELEGPGAPRASRRLSNHQRNRSRILGCARQLVTEAGLDNVHMHEVAERSGVSVQTLYNVVGGRAEMLGSAATEWMTSIARNAERLAAEHEVSTVFAIIEAFWASALAERRYATNLVSSKAASNILDAAFVKEAQSIIAPELARLEREGMLVEWVRVALLARHVAASCHGYIRDWLNAPYDEGRFRDAVVNSSGLLLRGAVRGAEVERVERGLDGGWTARRLTG